VVSLFGPQSFVRADGKPQVFRSSFPLPPTVTECKLLVTTADGGPLAANNVSISVNGQELVDAKKLRNADGSVQEGIVLNSENSLDILLKGKPGDAVLVTVVGTAPDEPTVDTTVPPVRPPRPPVILIY